MSWKDCKRLIPQVALFIIDNNGRLKKSHSQITQYPTASRVGHFPKLEIETVSKTVIN